MLQQGIIATKISTNSFENLSKVAKSARTSKTVIYDRLAMPNPIDEKLKKINDMHKQLNKTFNFWKK